MKRNTYHLFKIEDIGSYLFSDLGHNNNPDLSYDRLVLWRFYNDDLQIHFLQNGNFAFCRFGKSEKLFEYLISKGIALKEFQILSIENEKKFKLPDDYEFVISDAGDWGCKYIINKGSKRLFLFDTDGSNEKFKFYEKEVSLEFTGTDDKYGQPPMKVQYQLDQVKKQLSSEKKKRGCLNFFIGLIVLIVIMFILIKSGLI